MADRPIEAGWPDIVNSTGQPGTGTRINKQLFDEMLAALKVSLYETSLDEGPPEIAVEVTDARGGYGTLDERLDALEALASGGQATSGIAPSVNLVPNGNFLIWGKGKATIPSYWANPGLLTIAWQTAQGFGAANQIAGPYFVRMTAPDASDRDIYNDLVTVDDLTTYGGFRLTGQRFSGRRTRPRLGRHRADRNTENGAYDCGNHPWPHLQDVSLHTSSQSRSTPRCRVSSPAANDTRK